MFNSLSMLDMSNNSIRTIPTFINELNNLSVLNISGNVNVTDLPPEMGLLNRLWNLNTRQNEIHLYIQIWITIMHQHLSNLERFRLKGSSTKKFSIA